VCLVGGELQRNPIPSLLDVAPRASVIMPLPSVQSVVSIAAAAASSASCR